MKNPEAVKKWVEALRSGEFKQAKGSLRAGRNSYCCLGVACAIAKREGVIPNRLSYSDEGALEGAFKPVRNWLGLTSANGRFDLDGNRETLTDLNDQMDGPTFDQIADIIESEPEGLFE